MLSMNIQNFKTTWLDFKYIEKKSYHQEMIGKTTIYMQTIYNFGLALFFLFFNSILQTKI